MAKKKLIATDHAYKRARKRFRWNKDTLDKMMKLAWEEGITHGDTKGDLNKYISGKWQRYESANNIRIYGENIYLFADMTLITLYRVPNNLTRHLRNMKK